MSNVALVALAAGILGALGTLHMLYTFFTPKFDPYDPAVAVAMKGTSPRITRQTTIWRAWIGFNASHSLGAMFFGAVFLMIAATSPALLAQPAWLLLGLVTCLAYLAMAIKYWFRIPLIGIAIAATCFALATARTLI
ncbi:hypothetical protein BWI17_13335 [Betaproteobacteria bacterium GR16-43]|nr:hypothetical protein BWI17_13335 [Betaproteobacteria bacterium GR16-43]